MVIGLAQSNDSEYKFFGCEGLVLAAPARSIEVVKIGIGAASIAIEPRNSKTALRASFSWTKIAKRYQEFLQDIASDLQSRLSTAG